MVNSTNNYKQTLNVVVLQEECGLDLRAFTVDVAKSCGGEHVNAMPLLVLYDHSSSTP